MTCVFSPHSFSGNCTIIGDDSNFQVHIAPTFDINQPNPTKPKTNSTIKIAKKDMELTKDFYI